MDTLKTDHHLTLAGIDEAGYGPIMGPLVVALSSFTLESEPDQETDLWARFREVVRGDARERAGERISVLDSKEVYRSGKGLDDLELTALAFSSLFTGAPAATSAREFLQRHLVADDLPTEQYPWYRKEFEELELPLATHPEAVEAASKQLEEAAATTGVTPVTLAVRPLLAAEFNEASEQHDSKARVLFDLNAELIDHLRTRVEPPIHILCDRHGGRRHYQELLNGAFLFERVQTMKEERTCSRYSIGDEGPMEISYRVGGEKHGMEVALASILAKYTRELFVEALNRYFARKVDGIRRTAGYAVDGRRFLEDLDRARALETVERELLVRHR